MIRDIELAGLCQTIARDTDLDVTVGGEESFITHDGRRLNIAAMPMTPEGRLVAVGLAWHEVGHRLHTDMTGGPGPGLLGNLVNVIEDVREERDFIANRPGTAYDLDAVATYYISRGRLEPTDSATAVIALAMAYGRTVLLHQQAVEPMLKKARKMIEAEFGRAFLALAEGILGDYRSMPSGKTGTQASRDMALRLAGFWKSRPQPPRSRQQSHFLQIPEVMMAGKAPASAMTLPVHLRQARTGSQGNQPKRIRHLRLSPNRTASQEKRKAP